MAVQGFAVHAQPESFRLGFVAAFYASNGVEAAEHLKRLLESGVIDPKSKVLMLDGYSAGNGIRQATNLRHRPVGTEDPMALAA